MDQKLLEVVEMLKKKLGLEVIEMNWASITYGIKDFFKVPTTLVIPDGCEKVGNYAFYECEEMKEVIIPESVEEIGDFAFCDCWWLEEVVIPGSVREIRAYAFYDCSKLREAVIPVSVEYIGDYAFEDCREATIILKKPEKNFKYIGNFALDGCKDVKEEARN